MARPMKNGLDYFPLDCNLDSKMKLIQAEYGLIGFAVVVKLWQKIYGEQGYYCEWTTEVALLFAQENGLGGNAVSEIVNATMARGIFDKALFQKYGILTSEGIQKRYFEATARRKFSKIKTEYLLIKVAHFGVSVNNNSVNVNNNSVNVCNNPQSKVKESKVKKSKEESVLTHTKPPTRSAYGKFKNVFLSANEVRGLKQNYPYSYEAKIDRLSCYMESNGKNYKNHYAKLLEWLEQDGDEKKQQKQQREPSFDIDELEKINTDFYDKL